MSQILIHDYLPGNVDDCQPVPDLTQGLTGKLIGDRGYLSQRLFDERWVLATLVAYTYRPTKPSLNLTKNQLIVLNLKDY